MLSSCCTRGCCRVSACAGWRPAAALPGLALVFVESGGDNLAAAFSPELVDAWIYVIDVAGGDKVPRKGGPGITLSNLLMINKIDPAPMVNTSLDVMDRDARCMRGDKPFIFTNLKDDTGLDGVIAWLEARMSADYHGARAQAVADDAGDPHRHSHSHAHG